MAAAVEITPAIIPTARRVPDRFRTLSGTIAAVAPLILVVIVAILFQQAAPAVRHFGLGFLAGTDWNPVTDTFGALPAIFGTVATSFVALAIALPVGVAVAVVLAEQGQTTIRGILGTGIELLAAIPSVVYGIWA
ncbi:MAG TPA: phosphate ABC transporter permease subunit PstC, partial [Candidatus Dormibacteraeota bacterium]|nr:phosphate ABC transporter permease subunit PstC [Candidatus Dormibacteraeota bacterium]